MRPCRRSCGRFAVAGRPPRPSDCVVIAQHNRQRRGACSTVQKQHEMRGTTERCPLVDLKLTPPRVTEHRLRPRGHLHRAQPHRGARADVMSAHRHPHLRAARRKLTRARGVGTLAGGQHKNLRVPIRHRPGFQRRRAALTDELAALTPQLAVKGTQGTTVHHPNGAASSLLAVRPPPTWGAGKNAVTSPKPR